MYMIEIKPEVTTYVTTIEAGVKNRRITHNLGQNPVTCGMIYLQDAETYAACWDDVTFTGDDNTLDITFSQPTKLRMICIVIV